MIFPAFLRGPWVPDLWISIAAGFPILRPKNCLVFSNFNPSQNHSWGNHSRHGIPGRGKHFKALKPQTETVPEFLSCVSTSPFRSSQIQWTNQKKWLTPKNYIQWYTMIYPLIRKSGWWNFPVGFAEALWFSLGWSSQWCLGIEIDGPVWLLHFSDYHWIIGPFRWRKKHTYIYIFRTYPTIHFLGGSRMEARLFLDDIILSCMASYILQKRIALWRNSSLFIYQQTST